MTGIGHSRVRRVWAATAVAAAVYSAACLQPSLNPLFLPKEAIFEEGLLGAWVCGDETWTFTRLSDQDGEAYLVKIQTKAPETTSELLAWLGRLDDALFVTFTPNSDLPIPNKFVGRHLIPVYSFGRITLEPSRLRLAMLDADWVKSAEEAGLLTIGVKAAEPRADVLLTAKPADLQRFARVYSKDETVFGERLEFVRPVGLHPTGAGPGDQSAGVCYAEK